MNPNKSIEPVDILLVEDNPGDVRLIRETLKEGKLLNTLHVVGDGEEAIGYLRKQAKFAGAVRPHLILLDLNLPKMDGREVLAEIKNDPDLKRIPVVIVTSSALEKDILESYNLHANCYITKPPELNLFIKAVGAIENFWLSIVSLPNK